MQKRPLEAIQCREDLKQIFYVQKTPRTFFVYKTFRTLAMHGRQFFRIEDLKVVGKTSLWSFSYRRHVKVLRSLEDLAGDLFSLENSLEVFSVQKNSEVVFPVQKTSEEVYFSLEDLGGGLFSLEDHGGCLLSLEDVEGGLFSLKNSLEVSSVQKTSEDVFSV